jgi:hypothetical protein
MTTKTTILYSSFAPDKLVFTPLADNTRLTSQKISYVKYTTESGEALPQIQTPLINISTYGIPSIGKYYPTDESRTFIKLPLNRNNSEVNVFYEKLKELDELMDSEEMKLQIFGSDKVAKQYKYQTIIREPELDVEKDETFDTKPEYMKIKIDTDYITKEVKTRVMLKENKTRKVVEDISTISDLCKYVRYKSNIRLIIMINKLYATKAKVGDIKKYGLTFKVLQIECDPLVKKYSYEDDAFLDEDNEVSLCNSKLSKLDFDLEEEQVIVEEDNQEYYKEDEEEVTMKKKKASKKRIQV